MSEPITPATDEQVATLTKGIQSRIRFKEAEEYAAYATISILLARIEADRARIAELEAQETEPAWIGSRLWLIEQNTTLKARVKALEAILTRAAQGHDKDWEIPDQTPAECDQCNYDGMKEALAEGRAILARKEPPDA